MERREEGPVRDVGDSDVTRRSLAGGLGREAKDGLKGVIGDKRRGPSGGQSDSDRRVSERRWIGVF